MVIASSRLSDAKGLGRLVRSKSPSKSSIVRVVMLLVITMAEGGSSVCRVPFTDDYLPHAGLIIDQRWADCGVLSRCCLCIE